jgi:hypothetical protein
MKEIGLVLLVILVGFGGFGYVFNEMGDVNQEVKVKEAQIAKLTIALDETNKALDDQTQGVAQCQADLDASEKRYGEIKTAYTQVVADLQTTQKERDTLAGNLLQAQQNLVQVQDELAVCQAAPAITTPQPESTDPEPQVELVAAPKPGQGWSTLQIVGIMATIMLNALVLLILVWWVITGKSQHTRRLAAHPAERPLPAKPVTVKMNHQAYQDYLEYLRNHKQ